MKKHPEDFVKQITEQARPLEKAYYLAEWQAAVEGSNEAIGRVKDAQAAYMRFWSDPELFEAAGQLKRSGKVVDPLLARQLKLIYLASARNQQDEATIERLAELEGHVRRRYYNYRARVDGRELSDNEIDEILKASRDSEQVRQVWEASKEVGRQVAEEVREMARLRNATARAGGFRDHFHRSLLLDEIDERELLNLFADLEEQSRKPFTGLKAEIDRALSAGFDVPAEELRPWHYGDRFFQEGPRFPGCQSRVGEAGRRYLRRYRHGCQGNPVPLGSLPPIR